MLPRDLPLALYMEDALTGPAGKMGFGVLRYSPNPVVAVVDSNQVGRDAAEFGPWRSAPVVASVDRARELGARALVLGIAPPGGMIPDAWRADLDRAVESGLSLVNGLHEPLAPRYGLPDVPREEGPFVWDLRREPDDLAPGTGAARDLSGARVLMVGTDMAVGKMTAGLEIQRALLRKGRSAEFVATGQIGITITGAGVPLDAVRVDFASGAIERETLRAATAAGPDGVTIVEGQGSLVHPGSTATLPLLRGSCPTHLVLCVRAGQTHLRNRPEIAIPPLGELVRLYESLASACGTFPTPRTVGVAVNTVHLSPAEAAEACRALERELGLPAVDPVRDGAARLAAAI